MSKPVEVWCLINRGGHVGCVALSEVLPSSSFTVERRLLVREGETFADGVRAAAKAVEQLHFLTEIDEFREMSKQQMSAKTCVEAAKAIRALSPQPPKQDEATELRRHEFIRASVVGV